MYVEKPYYYVNFLANMRYRTLINNVKMKIKPFYLKAVNIRMFIKVTIREENHE